MPAYDYRCRTCDRVFEVRRSLTDDAGEVTCPAGHREVSRMFAAVAVGGLSGSAAGDRGSAAAGGCCGGGCCGGG